MSKGNQRSGLEAQIRPAERTQEATNPGAAIRLSHSPLSREGCRQLRHRTGCGMQNRLPTVTNPAKLTVALDSVLIPTQLTNKTAKLPPSAFLGVSVEFHRAEVTRWGLSSQSLSSFLLLLLRQGLTTYFSLALNL